MKKHSFRGGIHPYEGKDLSKDTAILPIPAGKELVYPLSQAAGAPAVPVVAIGDHVVGGQLIARAAGFMSVPIHASTSGVVKKIARRLSATGAKGDAIIIEADGKHRMADITAPPSYTTRTREELITAIQEAGIAGMGGAGFPTHVKLSPKDVSAIDRIIINCAECEPYLTSDYRRMLEQPQQIIEGLKAILYLFPNAKGILAIEDNKPECVSALRSSDNDPRISVRVLPTKYPQGAERQLIYAVTGRAINSAVLPMEVGCIVLNVDTTLAIFRALVLGRPLIYRVLTVTGDAIRSPRNLKVPIGTSYSELPAYCDGFNQEPAKFICGGPMMGFSLYDLNVPVTKTSSALLCLTRDAVSEQQPSPCIGCGRCVDDCPSRILPTRLAAFADHGDKLMFQQYDGMECCECGCCSYVCPAKRHLTQSIRSMRRLILAERRKATS